MSVKYDLVSMKTAALRAIPEYSMRGLFHTAKWLAEIVFALKNIELPDLKMKINPEGVSKEEYDKYLIANSYFRDQEYDRCVFYLKNTSSPVCKFLSYYATYMSLEYKKICGTTDANLFSVVPDCENYLTNMQELCNELKIEYINNHLDGFCLYVYGLVLKKLNHYDDAKDVLIEAIALETLNWGAWQELSPLIPEKNWVDSFTLPDHWMKDFFLGHLLIDLQMNKEAEDAYQIILNNGFHNSQYILGQIAICQHNSKAMRTTRGNFTRWYPLATISKDLKSAIAIYDEMKKTDPFRLEGMDTFSNLLYVAETRRALALLAHNVTEIDKYRVETSCVVGNYYSMRGDHTKAILSFQRAVKMNPSYVSAWTLMGHEYMEVKNTPAAILSYQRAIHSNKRDYRAWYGLGQTYELLRLSLFSLYYYKMAQKLRPQDGRMLIALGETYEKLEKVEEASKCYQQAKNLDGNDPISIIKLAKLLEKHNDNDLAASTFEEWVNDKTDIQSVLPYKQEFIYACTFLAKYHAARKDMDLAKQFAGQLQRHPELEDAYEKTVHQILPKKKDAVPSTSDSEGRRGVS